MSNNAYEIHLLCPSRRCRKCRRIIEDIEQIFTGLSLKLSLTVVTEIDEMLKYDVAILPALFVSGKLLFVGVIPRAGDLRRELEEFFKTQG